jgi:proline iminopeptidase/L-proline amide hydrolase
MVPVPGGRVYVRTNGASNESRLPVVLIHGGPGGTHGGLLDALELADERMVILYDQLDSGRSARPNDPANWNVALFVEELEAVRISLGISKWHVVGHSWGGTIALEYAAGKPAALASLVLAGPLISTRRWIADANSLRSKLPTAVQASLSRCESSAPPPKDECDIATAAYNSSFLQRTPLSKAATAYVSPQNQGFNARIYEAMWGPTEFASTGTLKHYDGEPLLARLQGARTLLLVGQFDEARLGTAADYVDRVAGMEFAVVPGAAHRMFRDRPDETVAIIRAWLGRNEAQP